jgi:hypothetical protein
MDFTIDDYFRFITFYKVGAPEECWLWTGKPSTSGYGCFKLKGKMKKAHRIVFFLRNAYLPKGDVHHKCETKLCMNPNHLEAKTKLEHHSLHWSGERNPFFGKGDRQIGEKNLNNKLTDEQRRDIFYMNKEGMYQKVIAKILNVSQQIVSLTLSGKVAPYIYKEFHEKT